MKYAENNRISHRQLYHQIILSFLAPLLICIPGYNGEQGISGTVGIMAAVLILLLYVFFLMRTSYCYADPVKIMGKLKGSLLGSFFLIFLIMTGVYILSCIDRPVFSGFERYSKNTITCLSNGLFFHKRHQIRYSKAQQSRDSENLIL